MYCVKNGVLLYQKDTQDADAMTWTTKRAGLLSIVQKNAENIAALIQQEGDETCLTRLMDAVAVTPSITILILSSHKICVGSVTYLLLQACRFPICLESV